MFIKYLYDKFPIDLAIWHETELGNILCNNTNFILQMFPIYFLILYKAIFKIKTNLLNHEGTYIKKRWFNTGNGQ